MCGGCKKENGCGALCKSLQCRILHGIQSGWVPTPSSPPATPASRAPCLHSQTVWATWCSGPKREKQVPHQDTASTITKTNGYIDCWLITCLNYSKFQLLKCGVSLLFLYDHTLIIFGFLRSWQMASPWACGKSHQTLFTTFWHLPCWKYSLVWRKPAKTGKK